MPIGWEWDETLFQGSAEHYLPGRPPYAPGLAQVLVNAVPLDRDSRVLDVGCGPGVIAVPLAKFVGEMIGVDPDPGMLIEAARQARLAGAGNCSWIQSLAEDLSPEIGPFRAVIFAQSFHWMDQPLVARIMQAMLKPGGAFVHVADAKSPRQTLVDLPYPTPPYEAITALTRRYLGPVRRAGQGHLHFESPSGEEEVLAEAGYAGPERITVPAVDPLIRSADQVVSWVYSLSGSAPHLFGDDLATFDAELRQLLQTASPDGHFADQPLDTDVRIWRIRRSKATIPHSQ